MKMRLDNIKAFLVSFSLVYYFSPVPFLGAHEIFPWYIFAPLFVWNNYKHLISLLCGVFIVTLIALYNLKIALDFAQIIVIFCFLFWYSKLSYYHSRLIIRWLERFLIAITLFLLAQKLFPDIFGQLTKLFSFRDGLNIDHRTGGVRGLAPEPSYMTMTIIGIGVILWSEKGLLNLKEQFLISFSVLLCGSLVGYAALSLLLFFHNYKMVSNFFTKLFFMQRVNKHLPYFLVFIFISIYLISSYFMTPLIRFFDLFYEIIISWDGSLETVLSAEEKFGSRRLQELLEPLSSHCCGFFFTGEFNKNYSLYGLLWAFFAPLHIFLFYFLVKGKLTAVKLLSINLAVIFGPVLIVSLYIGILRKKKNDLSDF